MHNRRRDSDDEDEIDARLLARVAQQDRAALGTLYVRHARRVLAMARTLVDESEASDVVHDVFIEVWLRAHTFDAARGSARAWLCLRGRCRALDRLKSPRVSRAREFVPELHGDVVEPSSVERADIERAIATLSVGQRAVVFLCAARGFSLAEAAASLGCPVGTIKSRLASARARLSPLHTSAVEVTA